MNAKIFLLTVSLSAFSFIDSTNATASKVNATRYESYEMWIDEDPYNHTYTINANWDDDQNGQPYSYKWYIETHSPWYPGKPVWPGDDGYDTDSVFNFDIQGSQYAVTLWCEVTRGGVTKYEGYYIEP